MKMCKNIGLGVLGALFLAACLAGCARSAVQTRASAGDAPAMPASVLVAADTDWQDTAAVEKIRAHLQGGGILAVYPDDADTATVCRALALPLEPEATGCFAQKSGVLVASLYYEYGGGHCGVYLLLAQAEPRTAPERDALVATAASEIETLQVQPAESRAGQPLGRFSVSALAPPQGKLTAHYTVYFRSDGQGNAFYTLQMTLFGAPGMALSAKDAAYAYPCFGRSLTMQAGAAGSGITVDAYGAYAQEYGHMPAPGHTYSDQLADDGISVDSTRTQAVWTCTFLKDAGAAAFCVEPYAAFVCPASKSSVRFSMQSTYTLYGQGAGKVPVGWRASLTCTP